MEPDLDGLIDFAASGGLFPQFEETWGDAFREAEACVGRVLADNGKARMRVALKTNDPLTFSALFVALCNKPVDVFLFNPNWSESEEGVAVEVSQPNWVLEDFEGREVSKIKKCSASEGMRVIIATGGTSGRIRFAIHSWDTLRAAVDGFCEHMGCEQVRSQCVLPLYHVSGFMQLVRAFLTKGEVAYGRLDTFLEKDKRDGWFLSLVATQLERLLRDEAIAKKLRMYQAIFLGGGPVGAGLLEKCRELELPVALTYGMTETAAQVATLRPEEFLRGASNQGMSLPHVTIAIESRSGLIEIVGDSLFSGYWGEEERRGTFVTSDIGQLEADGSLSVLGRSDGVLITGGEKVSLREVEICIEATGLVREVVAFAVENAEWGECLTVAYVPNELFRDENGLKVLVRKELTNYKYPKIWIQRTELPRNEAGKVIKKELV